MSDKDFISLVNEIIRKAVAEVKSNMKKKDAATLDVHKEAACLCGAIVKSHALLHCDWDSLPGNEDPYHRAYKFPNELFAFTAAMRIIRRSLLNEHISDEKMYRIIWSKVPFYPGNITDNFGYLSNTIFYINRFATKSRDCPFDIGAYSTIFYHLDLENRRHIKEQREDAISVAA
ncbi:MAG: hypothetical protein FWF77_10235 [Defluviitaleaceae bacterium]|nr:hypothetical protein [Defluviitaleaceae bacterium]